MAHEEPYAVFLGEHEHLGPPTAHFLGEPFIEVLFKFTELLLGRHLELRYRRGISLEVFKGSAVGEQVLRVLLLKDIPVLQPHLDGNIGGSRILAVVKVNIPLLGRIAAGTPIIAEENIEEYLSFPRDMFGKGEYFALHVRGDSMVEGGINDGDIAIIKKQNTAESGEIVAALMEDEATLKRFKRSQNKIELIPENSAYKPITVTDVTILGKLTAIFRKY